MPPAGPTPEELATQERMVITNAITAATTAVDAVDNDATDAQVQAAEEAVARLDKAIMDAANVPQAEKDANMRVKDRLESNLMGAMDRREMAAAQAEAAEMAAAQAEAAEKAEKGKALYGELGEDPLAFIEEVILASDGDLDVNADANGAAAGADPGVVMLKPGSSAGMLGEWKGRNYAHTDSGTKITNTALVYTNQDDPESRLATVYYAATENLPANVTYVAARRTLTLTEATHTMMTGDDFKTAGTFTHDKPGNEEGNFRGTYHGLNGTYYCTGTCTSKYVSEDSFTLAGSWTFEHDMGEMVSIPDTDYLYFGWWLREDEDGPTHASAFHGLQPATGTVQTDYASTSKNLNSLGGSLGYSGKAAGKFAMSDMAAGTGDAGHFTANVSLTATFSDYGDGGGIKGMINNFMANDVSVPWTVELQRISWAAAASPNFSTAANAAAAALPTPTAAAGKTVWSIDGRSAAASGNWEGTMYDLDADDGLDTPTAVTGKFQSEFGTTGRMVGAFGAEKDDD